MKTTLILEDELAARLKEEARRQGRSMSDLVDDALRSFFLASGEVAEPEPLPRFRGGRPKVDLGDREALWRAMEEDS